MMRRRRSPTCVKIVEAKPSWIMKSHESGLRFRSTIFAQTVVRSLRIGLYPKSGFQNLCQTCSMYRYKIFNQPFTPPQYNYHDDMLACHNTFYFRFFDHSWLSIFITIRNFQYDSMKIFLVQFKKFYHNQLKVFLFFQALTNGIFKAFTTFSIPWSLVRITFFKITISSQQDNSRSSGGQTTQIWLNYSLWKSRLVSQELLFEQSSRISLF